ncbi:MAG: DNA repair protein RadA [Bacteroidetes bacterium GWD2_45_23]|nr:MAG: DNA repair protein RadA [Bacteroidetes bacterium GWC2_46_850]OFX83711.1 MAG: DNA repair protein RadA [Bacteroidetes bacterium GWD2_45_23]HAR39134.1 DNA repair protein RadA [Porphyromonadaceae bacterium]HBA99506.1 DNA repair protein RadA [Porphyromonadaceae bacterium]HCC18550.1 DNA repair protein RadA [Porphyromonadaceae bacterium]
MAKLKSVYFCSNCGYEAPKWMGKCPSCGEWSTFVEELIRKDAASKQEDTRTFREGKSVPMTLREIKADEEPRIDMQDTELNRVLGGGLVPASVILIGGEPGIGKSTLVLQTILKLKGIRSLYVSGEESARQLKLRAERIGIENDDCLIVCETNLDDIFKHVKQVSPQLLIIDSIQTVYSDALESSPGSISQVRECAASLLKFAKQSGTPVLLIGHITKEGSIAGPKILEHIVDTVLQFEGDQHYMYRILRSIKNRFGSTAELGIYEMNQSGLREVSNPSELLLTQNHDGLSGVSIAAAIEGVRPFVIETQSLVSTAAYGTPQRSATGFDIRRMNMLLAVLEKRAGFKLAQKDVFLNIAGGLRVNDPGLDLSVISAVLSSSLDMTIERDTCLCGEVGLSGEIRPVNRIEQRIQEAEKLGFNRMLIPANNLKGIHKKTSIELQQVKRVSDAFRLLFS